MKIWTPNKAEFAWKPQQGFTPSTSAVENPELWQKKTKMTRRRDDREEMWYIQPLIFSFSFLPQTSVHSEEGSVSLSQTHMLRYFLLGVWGGQTVLWVTDWTLEWAPFSLKQCSRFSHRFLPFTVVSASLVVMSPSCLWLKKVCCT